MRVLRPEIEDDDGLCVHGFSVAGGGERCKDRAYCTVSCGVSECESDPEAAVTVKEKFCGTNLAAQPVNPAASAAPITTSTASLARRARPLRSLPMKGSSTS